MAKIIDRLTSNFDSTKFGTDINLSDKAKNYLNTAPISVPEWMKNDIANGSINRTDYFQNPVSSYVSSITSNVNSIIAVCVNDPANTFALASTEAQELANSSNTLISELQSFLSHTNRISGVSGLGSNTEIDATKPNYNSAMAVGGVVLTITASSDSVGDASPILNNFTSLYIRDELSSNSWSIGNSKVFLTGADTNTVTPVQLDQIRDKIETVYTMVNTRRTSDENYFYTSQQVIEDFQFLNALNNSGSTERNLINNLVGTTKLKNIVGS
jgi:hypothetical protein